MNEIEEIAKIVDSALKSSYTWTDEKALEVADELVNKLGYHKQVWHKTANGDLPKESGCYYCYCKLHFFDRHNNEIFDTVYSIEYFDLQLQSFDTISKSVIAWTELSEYEEI